MKPLVVTRSGLDGMVGPQQVTWLGGIVGPPQEAWLESQQAAWLGGMTESQVACLGGMTESQQPAWIGGLTVTTSGMPWWYDRVTASGFLHTETNISVAFLTSRLM